jgi:hypothetical protein
MELRGDLAAFLRLSNDDPADRLIGKRCPTTLENSIDSGWPFWRPVPRHQFVDAFLRPAIHQTRQ